MRNLMLSMLVLGVASTVVGFGGTFALFSATTTSTSNTFASATVSFKDVLNGGSNNCTSTAGATATGNDCTSAVGSFTANSGKMVPGDSKFGTVVMTNQSTVAAKITMAVTGGTTALTSNTIGTAATTATTPGLGLLIMQCTDSAGTDKDCMTASGGSTNKLVAVYGTCPSVSGTISNVTLPLATTTFNTTSLTDNGINVSSTECYGGNTSATLQSYTTSAPLTLFSSLASSATKSLLILMYFPPSASAASLQGLSEAGLTYTWVANQLAGSST